MCEVRRSKCRNTVVSPCDHLVMLSLDDIGFMIVLQPRLPSDENGGELGICIGEPVLRVVRVQ